MLDEKQKARLTQEFKMFVMNNAWPLLRRWIDAELGKEGGDPEGVWEEIVVMFRDHGLNYIMDKRGTK